MSNPWDRMDDESTKSYDAFTHYLKLGPDRSLAKAYQSKYPGTDSKQAKTKSNNWHRWMKANDWEKRASAYDDSISSQVIEQQRTMILDERTKELQQLRRVMKGQSTAIVNINKAFLEAFNIRVQTRPLDLYDPEDRALIRLFDVVTRSTEKGHQLLSGSAGLEEILATMGITESTQRISPEG